MRPSRARFPRLTILAILTSLLPSLAVEGHDPGEHLGRSGFEDAAVFLADHDEADRTLHIEPVVAVSASYCPGCLLPKKPTGAIARPRVGSALVALDGRPLDPPDAFVSAGTLSPQAPRPPPVS